MTRSLKNIFAITALALTCSPALRCEDTHAQTVSTSKLQSAINYVKNIRTPLTPQETLAKLIAQADVDGFKNTYNSFQKWTADDRQATLQALTITTQEVKQALQTELKAMGNAHVNKRTLAKGIGQIVGGLYGLGMAFWQVYFFQLSRGQSDAIRESILENLLGTPLRPIIKYNDIFMEMASDWSINSKIAALSGSVITPALIGSLLNWYGIQNCKNGWNYKAYLEQQITNIDEINEFIQAQLKLS